ncbi:hypothetical protein F443_10189 [Phytophthora nicotianae P1569]|uniref:DDE Tnp4 domain-containing protein n=5 Tax=Phytophthora nicotianae TaxID=4792 RepID=V9F380_PHYNI|nr:hypothetical protein F443_10189 [Phytophthora nicotianae P1569]
MSDEESEDQFRFTVSELPLLVRHMKLPNVVRTREGARTNSLEALSVCLRRLAYPQRWFDKAVMFGRAPSTLCHIFYFVVEFIEKNLGDMIYFDEERVEPAGIEGVWGFIDGIVRPICRPSEGQQAMYNGHKRVHALQFETVVTPDGHISRLFGPVDGRRHDLFMLNESGFKDVLKNNSNFHNNLICGDPVYGCTNVFCCPYKGCHLDATQQELNKVMSAIRVSV